MFCLLLVQLFGSSPCSPTVLKDIIAHTEALTKFPQQAFNDNQQNLVFIGHWNVSEEKSCPLK